MQPPPHPNSNTQAGLPLLPTPVHSAGSAVVYKGHVPIWKVLIRAFIPSISVRAPQAW